MKKKYIILTFIVTFILIASTSLVAHAEPTNLTIPDINISVDGSESPKEYVENIKIFLLLTSLSVLPSLILTMTSFTRISVVFGFLRNALGTQQAPSNQILIGLSLFLTIFVMSPTFTKINNDAIKPYTEETISQEEAIDIGTGYLKKFMLKQTRQKDLKMFMDINGVSEKVENEDLPMTAVIPAFIISELKTAFTIGFLLYLPFLIIDIVVGSILMSMGMMMIPPMMISLPFKLLLFVMVDGWNLIVKSLIMGF
ncbi:flagellar biosynthetic protein FliP [Clostridium bornimense]|uniref:Flagellar biosynthetic protein FliP n=1 Tax=Clostridium bornimense TaxID=1216932 RepID=W6RYU3_9CLOT|nr:flagellar type III secretion system pore protein FliP [Clostridium bornimense]CDM68789.1 flagellar biosynthetic protein FliP [Clostridium bornimense]